MASHCFTEPRSTAESRYCCGEVLNPDQFICPFCDEPTRTLSDASESYWTEVYADEPRPSLDEQHRAAWDDRQALRGGLRL